MLAQGETVRLRGERIWLSVGAAGNVEVTVDGKPKELVAGNGVGRPARPRAKV